MRYYETYHYVNIVYDVLDRPLPYLRSLNSWHEDREEELFSASFEKWSVLHDLAQFIICEIFFEQIDDVLLDSIVQAKGEGLWIDEALKYHDIEPIGFAKWLRRNDLSIKEISEDDIIQYHDALDESRLFTTLTEHLSREVFFVLFANRQCMAHLNKYVAGIWSSYSDRFGSPSERRAAIPSWAKRAVFFRDRGMCVLCNKDLGGILSTQPDEHFDHIVPIASNGINDITNLQLLCRSCNLTKGARSSATSNKYQVWYPDDA